MVERVRVAHGGKVLFARNETTLGRVIDLRYVGMMNTMMHETVASGTAHKADLPGWAAAGKTGTSQDFRDAWFIGYTSQFVTGVWLGNDDNTPTRKTTGGSLPVDIWSQFMKAAHRGKTPSDLPGGGMAVASSGIAALIQGGGLLPAPTQPVASSAPTPPANIGGGRSREPVRPEAGTIDGWFLDRLFSRR